MWFAAWLDYFGEILDYEGHVGVLAVDGYGDGTVGAADVDECSTVLDWGKVVVVYEMTGFETWWELEEFQCVGESWGADGTLFDVGVGG
jgi:hypothetical protein